MPFLTMPISVLFSEVFSNERVWIRFVNCFWNHTCKRSELFSALFMRKQSSMPSHWRFRWCTICKSTVSFWRRFGQCPVPHVSSYMQVKEGTGCDTVCWPSLRRNGTPPLFNVLPFEINNENYFLFLLWNFINEFFGQMLQILKFLKPCL